jgi:hypothetical protein
VRCNVPVAGATSDEGVLPERVQEALGQLVGAAQEGLLAPSVQVGLGVCASCWRRTSMSSWVRRETGTVVGPLSAMATRTRMSRTVWNFGGGPGWM